METMMRTIDEQGLPPKEVARGLLMAGVDVALIEMRFHHAAQFSADCIRERFEEIA